MTIQDMKETDLRHRLILVAPVLAYAGFIFLLSSFSSILDVVPTFFGFDKLVHFGVYYLFGSLICRWLIAERNRFANRHSIALTILLGTLYGLSDEWHQSFVPGRHASLWDALCDALGVFSAALTYPKIVERAPLWKNAIAFKVRRLDEK